MKNTLKGYLIGVLSTILLIGSVAYAASNTKTIEALYNNIKIYVDGVKIDPKDANGNTVEPFIYNGTTYLPVRAVGEAIGKTVTWDGATQSVYLGEKPGEVQYLIDVCPPYKYSQSYYHSEYRSSLGESFEMTGKRYTNGFTHGGNGTIYFSLDSKYQSLNFDVGMFEGNYEATIAFIVDEKTVKTVDLTYEDLAKNISVPLNNGLQLKIVITSNSGYANVPGIGFGNITVE